MSTMTPRSARWLALASVGVLIVVVCLVYASSVSTGFFADDYNFLAPAVRLDTPAYLNYVLDPRAQIMWYRPLQGIQFLIEFSLFGSNPVPYHSVQIVFHIISCALLFALVWRVAI